jgi:hypothetical protein
VEAVAEMDQVRSCAACAGVNVSGRKPGMVRAGSEEHREPDPEPRTGIFYRIVIGCEENTVRVARIGKLA